ncbi:MAG: hypothetical protein R3C60_02020 [Parvularculaceae bacterium]
MNAIVKKAALAALMTPIIMAIFLGLVIAAFSVPNAPVKEHLLERPDVLLARRADNGRVIDADTECIGMSVGLYQSGDPPPTLFLRAVTAESVYGCDPFMAWIENGAPQVTRDYFRYWHGYAVIARPVLAVMTYNDLRGLLLTASILLLTWLSINLGRDFGVGTGVAFALPFLVLNFMGLMVVATKAFSFMLAMAGALAARHLRKNEPPLLFFFGLGALTAYVDFFTMPFFIFTLAMMVWLIYRLHDGRKTSWTDLFFCLAFWGAGWAGFIIIKILIAALVLKTDAFGDAASAAFFRVHGASQYVKSLIPGAATVENIVAMKSVWAPTALVLFVIAPFATKTRRSTLRSVWRKNRPLLAIALAPLFWLEIFSNHSQIHAAFTQVNLAPAFIVAGLVLFRSPVLAQLQP